MEYKGKIDVEIVAAIKLTSDLHAFPLIGQEASARRHPVPPPWCHRSLRLLFLHYYTLWYIAICRKFRLDKRTEGLF